MIWEAARTSNPKVTGLDVSGDVEVALAARPPPRFPTEQDAGVNSKLL
jgi:hypothetical protein